MKTADLGPGNLFSIYAAASKGINKSKHSKYAALPVVGERCVLLQGALQERQRGRAAKPGVVPRVQVFDPLGISAGISLISLS